MHPKRFSDFAQARLLNASHTHLSVDDGIHVERFKESRSSDEYKKPRIAAARTEATPQTIVPIHLSGPKTTLATEPATRPRYRRGTLLSLAEFILFEILHNLCFGADAGPFPCGRVEEVLSGAC